MSQNFLNYQLLPKFLNFQMTLMTLMFPLLPKFLMNPLVQLNPTTMEMNQVYFLYYHFEEKYNLNHYILQFDVLCK